MDTNHIAQVLQDKKLQKHLNTKINRQFKTCRYIGDIVISEDEYIILKAYLRSICRKYLNTSERYITSPIFAVALVQIGIHKYDGRFWPHVEREIGMELPGSYQKWIGRSFYKTLEKYNKYKVAENEMMNNILLHCFITNYYASDLFDFLFAYYQIDLERDLTSNSKEMRDYLMQSMASGENTARAYKIKKHTSDAVAFNTRGCKIRVGKILRFMDNALFYGLFPRTSQNRIAQLFCKWADESKKFNQAKKAIAGLTKRGEKRYSSPYLRYNGNQNRFELVLPPQYIHLATNEELPNLHWKIVFSNVEKTLEAESENCVTGCKTRIVSDIYIPSDNIFDSIRIELIKNDAEVIHKFTNIRAACIRFFDNNWELIHYTTVPWASPTQIRPRPSRRPSRITALYLRSRSPALCLRRKRRPNAKSLTATFARSAGRKLRRPPTSASFAVSARSLWRGLTKRTPEWPVSRPKFSEGKSKGP